MGAEYSIREYAPADYPSLKGWWESRGVEAWPESLVPPDGMVTLLDGEPVASGWLFFVERSHLAFFHGLVTRPGLNRRQAREAIRHLCAGLDILMRSAGRTLMIGSVECGPLVRFIGEFEFHTNGGAMQPVFKLVKPE